jgi:signal transduction histidine kinase/CheY-like chemotaxis protein
MTGAPETSSRGDRGLFLRYGLLFAVVCVFLVAIFLSFQTLFDQRRLVEKESRIDMWFLAQTEIEYLRLMEALSTFGLAPDTVAQSQVEERFEIFWSRLPVLLKGPQTESLREVRGFVGIVDSIVQVMEAVEPALDRLQPNDPPALLPIRAKLEEIRPALREMLRRALLYESEEFGRDRSRFETYYHYLIALFAVALILGMAIFALLLRQIVKTHRAIQMARDAEAAAHAAQHQLEVAIGSISEGFILYDRDDRVAQFNERYRELHPAQADVLAIGVTFEDILRHAVERGFVGGHVADIEQWVQSCIRDHRNPGPPFESRLADGRWLRISERRTADGRIVGIHTDVTDLKSRELQLTEKTTLLQTTLDHMTHGIAVFDRNRKLALANDLFLRMHGLSGDFANVGRSYADIVMENARQGEYGSGDPEIHLAAHLRQIETLEAAGSGNQTVERRRPNGDVIEIAYTVLPSGGFVKTYTDVTSRVAAERDRIRLQDQFHASERMQALGTLAGGIAHDFNNILGIIIGNCDLALSEIKADDPTRTLLESILVAGERARHLVQQILNYSRQAQVNQRALNVAVAVGQSVDEVRAIVSSNVTIERGRWDDVTIAADPAQLHQIILNFCINSSHAIGNRPGRIVIAVEKVVIADTPKPAAPGSAQPGPGKPAELTLGELKPGSYCRILVSDTGDGIDPAILPKIFEPFFTTKEVGRGTGLGLAAVHGIVRNHKGIIAVQSELGAGTSISVYFPAIAASAGQILEPPSARASMGRERILLIDDDQMLISVTKKILGRDGYSVEAHARPDSGLAAFVEDPLSWDLVVSDRNMPGMSGEALAKKLLSIRPDLPIIMLTGFATPEDEERIRALGVRRIVMKPVVGRELAAVVRQVMDEQARPPLAASA